MNFFQTLLTDFWEFTKYLGKDAEIREPLERFERRARVPDPE